MVPILEDPATQSSPNCERGMIVCQQENICKDLCSEHSTAHKPVLFGAELIGRTVRLMLKQGRQQGGSLRWGNKRVVVGFAAGLHVLKEDMKDGKPEQVYLGPGLRFKIEQGEDDDLPANPSHDPSLDSQLSVGRKLSVFWTGMSRLLPPATTSNTICLISSNCRCLCLPASFASGGHCRHGALVQR
jgi:hypothetical protein